MCCQANLDMSCAQIGDNERGLEGVDPHAASLSRYVLPLSKPGPWSLGTGIVQRIETHSLAISVYQKIHSAPSLDSQQATGSGSTRAASFSFGVAFVPRVRAWLRRVMGTCDVEQHAASILPPSRAYFVRRWQRYGHDSPCFYWAVLAVVSYFMTITGCRVQCWLGSPGSFYFFRVQANRFTRAL